MHNDSNWTGRTPRTMADSKWGSYAKLRRQEARREIRDVFIVLACAVGLVNIDRIAYFFWSLFA